jgi:hypothetical protein
MTCRELGMARFCVRSSPTGSELMMILRAYCDESGKDEKRDPFFAYGGFIMPLDEWGKFDEAWGEMLHDHNMPYLHINELRHAFRDRPAELDAFLTDAVSVILDHQLWAYVAILWRAELREIAASAGLTEDPYAWGIYMTAVMMQTAVQDTPFQMVLDRMEQGPKRVGLAEDLFRTDLAHNHRRWPTITPLSPDDEEGSDNIPGLQAADLIVWEARNGTVLKKPWFDEIKPTIPREQWTKSLREWRITTRGYDEDMADAYIFDRKPLARLRDDRRVRFAHFDGQALREMLDVRAGKRGRAK